MNFFGSGCGCTSSCDTLWYIILISLICNCGCGCGCNNSCQNGCGYDDNKCGCGCGIDICSLIILLIVFGCCGKNCK